MAEMALCRYHCPNCDAELEQEGYIIIEAQDTEPLRQLLAGEANMVNCPNCDATNRLNIPLLFHHGPQGLFIIFVPDLAQLGPEQLAENIKYPYGLLATREAERRGIALPEPDAAAFPRGEEDAYIHQPGAPFHALTQEQAEELLPEYLLRPTIVDNFDVLRTAAQAVLDGMTGQQVVEDMARLQLINAVISTTDPIERRKLLHHNEPYLNADLYEVIDTLREQMNGEGQAELAERLGWVRQQVERYKQSQQQRLKTRKKDPAQEHE